MFINRAPGGAETPDRGLTQGSGVFRTEHGSRVRLSPRRGASRACALAGGRALRAACDFHRLVSWVGPWCSGCCSTVKWAQVGGLQVTLPCASWLCPRALRADWPWGPLCLWVHPALGVTVWCLHTMGFCAALTGYEEHSALRAFITAENITYKLCFN